MGKKGTKRWPGLTVTKEMDEAVTAVMQGGLGRSWLLREAIAAVLRQDFGVSLVDVHPQLGGSRDGDCD